MLSEILAAYEWYDHPEGLKFVETHRDAHRTSGHWLLLPGAFSTFHKWTGGDELWFIHAGRVALHVIEPAGAHWTVVLGTNVAAGERPAAVVSADAWQAAELVDGEDFGLGTVVCSPPFAFEKLVSAEAHQLSGEYPQHETLIRRLTR